MTLAGASLGYAAAPQSCIQRTNILNTAINTANVNELEAEDTARLINANLKNTPYCFNQRVRFNNFEKIYTDNVAFLWAQISYFTADCSNSPGAQTTINNAWAVINNAIQVGISPYPKPCAGSDTPT